jgi:hypothetical protein
VQSELDAQQMRHIVNTAGALRVVPLGMEEA